ncbi:PTS system mannose/fructose/N-acetylgalactosamine-transporter subunit IIB [Enterococcus crotali]
MSVKVCRIDDRLIHGQVVTSWLNTFKVEQIVIVSNETAGNDTQRSILKMSTPPNVITHIFTTDQFLTIAKKGPIKKSTLLLSDSVFDIETIIDGGFEINDLNVGGLRLNEQRERVSKQVSVTKEERECFKRLIDKGVNVEIRMVPSDTSLNMKGEI